MSLRPVTNLRRYLATHSTQTAFTLTGGIRQMPTGANIRTIEAGAGLSSALVFFLPGAADNDNKAFRIWAYQYLTDSNGDLVPDSLINMQCLGEGVCTASTQVGPSATALITSTDRVCDTLTWTPSDTATTMPGPLTAIETAFSEGNSDVYSPANNTAAMLFLPALGRFSGFLIEFANSTVNAPNANALIGVHEV